MTALEQLTTAELTECQTLAYQRWDRSFEKTYRDLRICLHGALTGRAAFEEFITEEQENIAGEILAKRNEGSELLMA